MPAPQKGLENYELLEYRLMIAEKSIEDLRKSDIDLADAAVPVAQSIQSLQVEFAKRTGADRVITVILSMLASGLIAWASRHF